MAHDDRRPVEAPDDFGVVVGDLRHAESVHGRRVAPELLHLCLHPWPRGGQHLVAAALEALLPALPAAGREPESMDQDDGRGGSLGRHGFSYVGGSVRVTATLTGPLTPRKRAARPSLLRAPPG